MESYRQQDDEKDFIDSATNRCPSIARKPHQINTLAEESKTPSKKTCALVVMPKSRLGINCE